MAPVDPPFRVTIPAGRGGVSGSTPPDLRGRPRQHPEYLVVPIAAAVFVIDDAPFGHGPGNSVRFLTYPTQPDQNGIFPFTWTSAA